MQANSQHAPAAGPAHWLGWRQAVQPAAPVPWLSHACCGHAQAQAPASGSRSVPQVCPQPAVSGHMKHTSSSHTHAAQPGSKHAEHHPGTQPLGCSCRLLLAAPSGHQPPEQPAHEPVWGGHLAGLSSGPGSGALDTAATPARQPVRQQHLLQGAVEGHHECKNMAIDR
jgi:hypothetical protein